MRGLLAVLGLAIATLVVLVVIGVQFVAPAVVAAAVRGSPAFAGQPVTVDVRTSLTGLLLHGWIDEITVQGSDLQEARFQVGQLSLSATDVALADRIPAHLDGTLANVTATTLAGTEVHLGNVEVSGSAAEVTIVGTVDAAALEAALAAELQPLGISGGQVRVVDGTIRIRVAGQQDVATLRLEGGALVLDPGSGLAPITLLRSPADRSWQLSEVIVSAAGARVSATLDLARLALGA